MNLDQVNIVGLHHAQTVLHMPENAVFGIRPGFCGQDNVAAYIVQRKTDLLLAVGIGVGGIKKANAALVCGAQETDGIVLVAALNRQTAHGGLGGDQTAFPQSNLLHDSTPFVE